MERGRRALATLSIDLLITFSSVRTLSFFERALSCGTWWPGSIFFGAIFSVDIRFFLLIPSCRILRYRYWKKEGSQTEIRFFCWRRCMHGPGGHRKESRGPVFSWILKFVHFSWWIRWIILLQVYLKLFFWILFRVIRPRCEKTWEKKTMKSAFPGRFPVRGFSRPPDFCSSCTCS